MSRGQGSYSTSYNAQNNKELIGPKISIVEKSWSNFALCLECWVFYSHFSAFLMSLCFKVGPAFILGVCYPCGGRAQEVVSLLSWLILSFSQAVCPESKFGSFLSDPAPPPNGGQTALHLWRVFCPPQRKEVSPSIGAGLGCLLPLLRGKCVLSLLFCHALCHVLLPTLKSSRLLLHRREGFVTFLW